MCGTLQVRQKYCILIDCNLITINYVTTKKDSIITFTGEFHGCHVQLCSNRIKNNLL